MTPAVALPLVPSILGHRDTCRLASIRSPFGDMLHEVPAVTHRLFLNQKLAETDVSPEGCDWM